MNKNIFGLDVNVDQNYIADAVKEAVMLGIAEGLNGKNEIASQIVNSVLSTKVDKNGKMTNYKSDEKYSLLQFYLKEILETEVKNELKDLVEEKRPEIREIIREQLRAKATINSFTDKFIESIHDSVASTYANMITVEFTARDESY